MGIYYGKSEPPPEEEQRGCRDVWLLTRAAFGILLLPMGILVGALAAVVLIIALFSRASVLGLLGIAIFAVGVYAYALWERHHFRGP
ncbi:MAG TPA: hypothetical protein VK821_00380 [Dehalococcoidia bacterium]|nr:hypothetical protein [Dehalococcoidia bacterium]